MFCQSSGSKIKYAISGSFPINFSYGLVKKYDGLNDGLVGEDSFEFGEKYMFLTPTGMMGISHGDVIGILYPNIDDEVQKFIVFFCFFNK